ncbi:hypothetical protein J4218_00915 [Candidatus Pacearchaeota archaeon]|nr:hypothetical protein [Candidatus Pacearchaeota archaeon]
MEPSYTAYQLGKINHKDRKKLIDLLQHEGARAFVNSEHIFFTSKDPPAPVLAKMSSEFGRRDYDFYLFEGEKCLMGIPEIHSELNLRDDRKGIYPVGLLSPRNLLPPRMRKLSQEDIETREKIRRVLRDYKSS